MAPTLVAITGSLYDGRGQKLVAGRLTVTPSAIVIDSVSLIGRTPVILDIPGSGDLSFSLVPSHGVPYDVTFDPDPDDTSTPLEEKSGSYITTWTVPASGPINITDL